MSYLWKVFRKRTFCLCSCIEKLRGTHIILEMFSLQFPIISQDNVAANKHTYQHQVNSGPRSDLDYLGHYKKPRLRLKHSLLVVCCWLTMNSKSRSWEVSVTHGLYSCKSQESDQLALEKVLNEDLTAELCSGMQQVWAEHFSYEWQAFPSHLLVPRLL